jgi:hypothetical protein
MFKALILLAVGSFLFRFGGRDQISWIPLNQKLWRSAVLPIVAGAIYGNVFIIAAYAITLNCFAWGENKDSWINLRKLVGKYAQWFICGFAWSVSCFPSVGIFALGAGLLGGLVVLGLMTWSNDGILIGYTPSTYKIEVRDYLDHAVVEYITGGVIVSGFLIKEIICFVFHI